MAREHDRGGGLGVGYRITRPYGGMGYVLSRGLLDAIPRATWEKCMYAMQCANADHRLMNCVLNEVRRPLFRAGGARPSAESEARTSLPPCRDSH